MRIIDRFRDDLACSAYRGSSEIYAPFTAVMSSVERPETSRSEFPDPSSHATNVNDTEMGSEWPGEDNDFEPTTDEDSEFFDPNEEAEEAFHGSLSEHVGLGGSKQC